MKVAFTTKSEKEIDNTYKNMSWMKYFVMLTNFFFSNIQECHGKQWDPNAPFAKALNRFLKLTFFEKTKMRKVL